MILYKVTLVLSGSENTIDKTIEVVAKNAESAIAITQECAVETEVVGSIPIEPAPSFSVLHQMARRRIWSAAYTLKDRSTHDSKHAADMALKTFDETFPVPAQ